MESIKDLLIALQRTPDFLKFEIEDLIEKIKNHKDYDLIKERFEKLHHKTNYIMMGADFSAQEPRMLASLSGDERMIQTYLNGEDLYCAIASASFGVPYEDCKEFYPDGTTNKEGKERRSSAKKIVLGVMYGRGIRSIAEQLGTTPDKAKEIHDKVLENYPKVKEFMESSKKMAKELGYVTTLLGRRRRLPDYQLPLVEARLLEDTNFNPFFEDFIVDNDKGELVQQYINALSKAYGFANKDKIKKQALADGIELHDNGGYIADAERQILNSRIQGSAADQSKVTMIAISNDPLLKKLGFRLLLQIHDEMIGECPEENAKECAERFQYLMEHSFDAYMKIPSKCDVSITREWYGDELDINNL